MSSPRIVVVGGGVVGLSCAYYLARAGADVVVLERQRVGAGASSGNAGTIAAGHPPLNRPGRVRKALKQMLDPTSPLYVRPRWDPRLWTWLLDFARHCTEEHVQHAMSVMAPIGMEALESYEELLADEAIDCGYHRGGFYDVCTTPRALADAHHEADIVARHGYHPETLDGSELRGVDGAFGPGVLGGIFYPEAATLDPARFLTGLAAAARRLGVDVGEGAEVERVVVEQGCSRGVRLRSGETVAADAVLVATGPFSLGLAEALGTRLPVQPGKGYHRDVAVGAGGAPPLGVACVINEASVFCTPMNGFVRFAGTMEFSGENAVMRRPRLEQLTRAARLCLPELGDAEPVSEWCGLRPMASDGLPIVGRLPGVEGCWVATGHGMLGLTLGPLTGRILTREILDGSPSTAALSPERFS